MLNLVVLNGYAGADPSQKKFANGGSVTEFPLATATRFKGRDGNMVTDTQWHKIKAYNGIADIAMALVVKGSSVSIQGKLKYDSWIDSNGSKQLRAYIFVEELIVHDKKVKDYSKPKPEGPKDPDEYDLPF